MTNNEKPASKWIVIKVTNTNKERRDTLTKVQKGERNGNQRKEKEKRSWQHECDVQID